jgi:ATP synthase F1 gamma subunit
VLIRSIAAGSFSDLVNENDCIYKAGKGTAGHAEWERVWHRQFWFVDPFLDSRATNTHMVARPLELFKNASAESPAKTKLFIVISSDKGLCGGIHSSVSKATRRALADTENPVDEHSPIMVIGDKSKAQLSRAAPKNIALTFNQIGRDIPTFADAAGVADLIMKSDKKYDSIVIVYNKFVSALSYEAAFMEVVNETALKESRKSHVDHLFALFSSCWW